MHRALCFRLSPTAEQEEFLVQFAGAARFIYNLALEQRRDWWRQHLATTGKRIHWTSQSREVTELRGDLPWLAAVPRSICEHALRDLDQAFAAFFAKRAGFPGFRGRDRSSSFRVQGRDMRITPLNRKWALIHLPKCPAIKMRLTREITGAITSVSVRKKGGHWQASLLTETEVAAISVSGEAVGIDRGVANTISLSTGEHFRMPSTADAKASLKRAQRAVARRKRGSARRHRAKAVAARRSAKVAAVRAHWLHERSADIARRFSAVVIEALSIRAMTRSATGTVAAPGVKARQKSGLNRSILEQGWGNFAKMLEYKLAARGGTIEYVNPAYTSQTCSDCGSVNSESRKSQAVFHCVDCGHRAHADTNAAMNILRRSPAFMRVEEAGCGSVEARTGVVREHHEDLAIISRGEADPVLLDVGIARIASATIALIGLD